MKSKASEKVAGHTPGPWEFDDTLKYYPKRVVRHNGVLIASIFHCNAMEPAWTDQEMQANACLIAQAPALLEACKFALSILLKFPPFDKSERMAIEKLEAVITKAEQKGESS